MSPGAPGWRRQLRLLLGLLAAGVLMAFLWRLLDPVTTKLGDDEAGAGVDSTLALLGVVAGFLTAAFVLWRPGRYPITRTAVAIGGSVLAAVVSWKIGDLLGTPHLRAVGAAFIWPMATAVCLCAGALLPGTSSQLERAGGYSDSPGDQFGSPDFSSSGRLPDFSPPGSSPDL